MAKIIDLIGKRFGKLEVINFAGVNKFRKALWYCKCACGGEKIAIGSALKNGRITSCGCLEGYHTHGFSRSRICRVHYGMMGRCYSPIYDSYKYYGERGIKVCNEWHDFIVFYEWAIASGYDETLTIDRINVNKDYCPENCRWITRAENNKNKTNSRLLTLNGETKTLPDWSRLLNIPMGRLYSRLYLGWSDEDILRRPKVGA
jgi:hypothetical protein